MADVQTESQASGGKVRTKKRSTKIDMTPMVDLAFLLLTFFILTTSFKKPYVMEVVMPEPVPDERMLAPISDKNILNVVLHENDKIYWWIGLTSPVHKTDYSRSGIRKVLLEKRSNPRLMVLIKVADNARFQNMVDILDEVEITKMPRFAIVDYEEQDSLIIAGR